MEERIARLESDVAHLRSDVADIKVDIRGLRSSVDDVRSELHASVLHTEKSFAALKVGRAMDRVWWLLIAGAMLAVMARGFKWI